MATASAGIYRPRYPERTVLYRVFAQHFERFVQVYDERFVPTRGPLPPGAQEAVNRYLDCGIFACGFARLGSQRTVKKVLDWAWIVIEGTVVSREGWYEYKTERIGQLDVNDAGRAVVRLYPEAPLDHYLMYFNKIELMPVR